MLPLRRKKNVIEKAIRKYGREIIFKRKVLNEFGESEGEETVAKMFGFYYRGNNILQVKSNIAGITNSSKEEKLMMILNGDSRNVKVGDTFNLNDIEYRIIDLGNAFDLYYDITLERCGVGEV